MKKVAIVDYGMCNLDSVFRAVEECGGNPVVTGKARDFECADYIILPGVGAFANAMHQLRQRSLDAVLQKQVIDKQIPFLGICLGMHLMAKKGWEGGETEGLGFIDGEVRHLRPDSSHTRLPHVGWNEVVYVKESSLFNGIRSGKDFYFVHSYHLCCSEENVIARTPYCGEFVSAISDGLTFGVQFHPEKSQRLGLQVLRNFLSI
ncbi:MAG: imidazole glycerol phosphate synthase, glutamine amidotransferase subunit [Desulfobacterales bacterium PC51MH44]|nr:MAG: imidazole glycerol phosphate synthase, glutamine amidotransferase subunit [Desulfobacterales bacterium PC51MH44]